MWIWFYKLASPPFVYVVAAALTPWFLSLAALTIGYGLIAGLGFAPPDYQQGDALSNYLCTCAERLDVVVLVHHHGGGRRNRLIWRIKMGHAVAAASAPIGASFTLLALVTGSLWGRPMWGTYWAWDPRLTSELILLFLYVGMMSLRSAFEDPGRGDRAAALLAIVGVVNVPIIHYSVSWWNSLHQGATVAKLGKPAMPRQHALATTLHDAWVHVVYGAVLCMRLQVKCSIGSDKPSGCGRRLKREQQLLLVRGC